LANFQVAANADAECYLTVLPGGGGGLEANVNRWRTQMGLGPLSPEEIGKLEKKTVLGKEAAYAEFEGAYQGMSGTENKQGFKLLGVILDDAGSAVFAKMTGPADVVNQEKANFDAFCQSLKAGAEGTHMVANLPEGHPDLDAFKIDVPATGASSLPEGHPPINPAAGRQQPRAASAGASLTWQGPESWKRSGERPMRLVTYTVGGGEAECYVTLLSGVAGGVDANINRWRSQMGITETLDSAAIAALPKITVLGEQAPLVEIEGKYTGMDGQATEGYMLYGTVCDLDGETLFVKLVGPSGEIKGEHDNFVAFCQSLAK
jgi:hypothetical protein